LETKLSIFLKIDKTRDFDLVSLPDVAADAGDILEGLDPLPPAADEGDNGEEELGTLHSSSRFTCSSNLEEENAKYESTFK
jgi:hypothetical protein